MKIVIAACLLLAGCASTQIPFQKGSDSPGYTVQEKSPANLAIQTKLPADLEQKSIHRYVARAVGEECLERGFSYFDLTEPKNGAVEGFCFKENKRKAVGITFQAEPRKQNPELLIVEHLNNKTQTFLQPGDQILKAGNQNLNSVGDLKILAFQSGAQNKSEVQLELVRAGKKLQIKEPLVDMTEGAYGPQDLSALRKR